MLLTSLPVSAALTVVGINPYIENCDSGTLSFAFIFMVARSSDSESELPLYFKVVLFIYFFLSPHFLRRQKTDIPETFPHDVA